MSKSKQPEQSATSSISIRDAFLLGIRDVSPTYPGAFSFGLITGVTAKAMGLEPVSAIVMSFLVFSGTAQLASLQLYSEGASLFIILVTVASVNFRYLIYSATLTPYLKHLSLLWRIIFTGLMVDQSFAFCINRFQEQPQLPKRAYYLGISLPLVFVWGGACAIGVLIGTQIPQAWSLGFSLPLVFIALAAMTIKSKAGILAALVGGSTAAMFTHLPNGVGLIIATIIGVAAAIVSERWLTPKTAVTTTQGTMQDTKEEDAS